MKYNQRLLGDDGKGGHTQNFRYQLRGSGELKKKTQNFVHSNQRMKGHPVLHHYLQKWQRMPHPISSRKQSLRQNLSGKDGVRFFGRKGGRIGGEAVPTQDG